MRTKAPRAASGHAPARSVFEGEPVCRAAATSAAATPVANVATSFARVSRTCMPCSEPVCVGFEPLIHRHRPMTLGRPPKRPADTAAYQSLWRVRGSCRMAQMYDGTRRARERRRPARLRTALTSPVASMAQQAPDPCVEPVLSARPALVPQRIAAVTYGQAVGLGQPTNRQVTAHLRSPRLVPPAGLEPAAYRLGGGSRMSSRCRPVC
jgi:hypothetical protein